MLSNKSRPWQFFNTTVDKDGSRIDGSFVVCVVCVFLSRGSIPVGMALTMNDKLRSALLFL